jgi:hypothetical protein
MVIHRVDASLLYHDICCLPEGPDQTQFARQQPRLSHKRFNRMAVNGHGPRLPGEEMVAGTGVEPVT